MLFATGSEDGILEASKRLASATPQGEFLEIPGRHHFNAPGSRAFREAAIAFLAKSVTAAREASVEGSTATSSDATYDKGQAPTVSGGACPSAVSRYRLRP